MHVIAPLDLGRRRDKPKRVTELRVLAVEQILTPDGDLDLLRRSPGQAQVESEVGINTHRREAIDVVQSRVELNVLGHVEEREVAGRFSAAVLAVFYVALLINFLGMIRRDLTFDGAGAHDDAQGGHWIVFVLLVTWIGDTGAYFAGRFLGKRKLYPSVSPNKTWAGSIGGIAASMAGAIGLKLTLLSYVSWIDLAIITIVGAILGQMGDLVESLLKRSYGVKDSGSLLGGHGGIFDRIDAVLFMAPWVYLYWHVKPLIV